MGDSTERRGAPLSGQGFAVALLGASAVCSRLPLTDGFLERADLVLGLDWVALHTWVHEHPWLSGPITVAYNGLFGGLAAICFIAGILVPHALARLLAANIICSALVAALSALIPAVGPPPYFGLPMPFGFAEAHEIQMGLRDGSMGLSPVMEGLITFPSYHAALALLIALAATVNAGSKMHRLAGVKMHQAR
jgi:hypothetical protein